MAETTKRSNDDDDKLAEARKMFARCVDAEDHNRVTALDDLRFARLGEQWPEEIVAQRRREQRPCLTINKLNAFIRQVVNDSRQNKPSIKVHPADSGADVKTADVINGLIRNIEYTSNADIAYDTAIEQAVSMGFGYFRISLDYSYDDSFDLDIRIERLANGFAVYGDPNATSADGSDWNVAFVTERVPRDEFKRKYEGKALVDFDADDWERAGSDWLDEDSVLVAEWWTREEIERDIVKLDNGAVYSAEDIEADPDLVLGLEMGTLSIVGKRTVKSHKVRQVIMSGCDVLEERDWPGRYIPIVPVYGDEFDVEGKRYFRSLIHPAKDPQRMFNYWRTAGTELVALAPKVPYIGPQGAFDVDQDKWQTINTVSHPYVEYSKTAVAPPQRQPLDTGVAAGALQEALNSSDDMKAIMGMYDASMGARSNETSGRAIMARQREGDVSTFHFIDNLSRAIRHAGRIIIDLIPKVYTEERVIRVIGEDGKEKPVPVNQQFPDVDEETGEPKVDETGHVIMAMHDLTAGKYDLTVTTGPSFTTRREEAAAQMTELVRAFPQSAPFIADIMARNFDWPGADEIAKRFEKMLPGAQKIPPQVQQMLEQGQAELARLTKENEELKAKYAIEEKKVQVSQFDADTDRMKVQGDLGMGIMEMLTPPVQPQQPPR